MKVKFVQCKGRYQIKDLKNQILFEHSDFVKILTFIKRNNHVIISCEQDRTGRSQGVGLRKSTIIKSSDRASKQTEIRFSSLQRVKGLQRTRTRKFKKWNNEQLLYLEALCPSRVTSSSDWEQIEQMAEEALNKGAFDFDW